jgi:hypothetical protein
MEKTVYVLNGIVVSHVTVHDSTTTTGGCAIAGVAPYVVDASSAVDAGWTLSFDALGNPVFTAPPAKYPTLTPVQFYTAFSAAEMIAIKASTDPMVKEFYARYQIALQTNTPIDPNLVSVQEGLSYLAAPVSPGPGAGIFASSARIAQIAAGVPQ